MRSATLQERDSRLGIFGLRNVCRSGRLLVFSRNKPTEGLMVWNLGPREFPPDFVSLHVVVWAKVWDNRAIANWSERRFLVQFRDATQEEITVESIMRE